MTKSLPCIMTIQNLPIFVISPNSRLTESLKFDGTLEEAAAKLTVFLIRFFEDYKKNENKQVVVDTMLGAQEALQAVKSAIVRHINITLSLTQMSVDCIR